MALKAKHGIGVIQGAKITMAIAGEACIIEHGKCIVGLFDVSREVAMVSSTLNCNAHFLNLHVNYAYMQHSHTMQSVCVMTHV